MKSILAAFVTLSLLAAEVSFADEMRELNGRLVLIATFRKTSAESASCLVRPSYPASVLERYDVKMVGSADGEQTVPLVAAILRETERLHGKLFAPFHRMAVDVNANYRILGQQVYDAQLRRAKVIIKESSNLALVAHEMGHIIGNSQQDGRRWYSAYNAAVSTPCHHTWYSSSGWNRGRRNEEFAEVFAAYITHPNLLRGGSASCRQAYEFMRTRIFPNADPACLASR
ncbi:MAG: hypothetical protein ACK5P7_13775 [Bdellovibrio sp.]